MSTSAGLSTSVAGKSRYERVGQDQQTGFGSAALLAATAAAVASALTLGSDSGLDSSSTAATAASVSQSPRTTPTVAKPGVGLYGGNEVALPQVPERKDLPTFTLDQFRKGESERVWVALDCGVYDVT